MAAMAVFIRLTASFRKRLSGHKKTRTRRVCSKDSAASTYAAGVISLSAVQGNSIPYDANYVHFRTTGQHGRPERISGLIFPQLSNTLCTQPGDGIPPEQKPPHRLMMPA